MSYFAHAITGSQIQPLQSIQDLSTMFLKILVQKCVFKGLQYNVIHNFIAEWSEEGEWGEGKRHERNDSLLGLSEFPSHITQIPQFNTIKVQ
jgi:hypothetical protein